MKIGEYKTNGGYSWLNINGSWHKYNAQYDNKSWIQSVSYRDKYENTLNKDSYKAIGGKQEAGSCILLYAKDAEWIYNTCNKNTVISIIKGTKNDKLPMVVEDTVKTVKYCGWDPTDPDKSNPYKSAANGKIAMGMSTVYVEKGHDVDYFSNLLAKDENGKNITGLLKYEKINTTNTGTYKVTYTYKTKAGNKLKAVQKYKVIDTTCPVVTCSESLFQYEVESLEQKDLNKESTVKEIEKMVRASVSCNEPEAVITVSCLSAEELREGEIPVVVKAQDKAGNIGSCQVMCEIKLKEPETETEIKTKKEKKEKTIKESKKVEKSTTKSNKNKKDEKQTEKETTKQISTKKEEETTTVNE